MQANDMAESIDHGSDPLPQISNDELERRVLYTMLAPCVNLARGFALPLKELAHLVETAYYHELKRAGLKQSDAADVLGVSSRKVVTLSRQLKEIFRAVELEGTLPRKIEFLLWTGPQTEGRLRQFFHEHSDAEISASLGALQREGRVKRLNKRPAEYLVEGRNFRLYKENWIARLDGLNNLLGNVRDVIRARFFERDERAFARTLSFRLRAEDLEELQALYEEVVWPRITELEARVDAAEDAETFNLSMLWAPHQEESESPSS